MKSYLVAKEKGKNTFGGGVVQAIARGMLGSGMVIGLVSFIQGWDARDIRPALLTVEEEADSVVLSDYNPYGLSRILKGYIGGGRVGLIGRTCDVRAAIELAKRNQVNLDDIYTIGIACTEPRKCLSGETRGNCLRCQHFIPTMADLNCVLAEKATIVEAMNDKGAKALAVATVEEVAAFDPGYDFDQLRRAAAEHQEKDFAVKNLSFAEKLSYWFSQFDKCLKCYGCRNVCPICYCKECVLEGDRGIVPGGEIPPAKLFHLTRLAHVADSCLNCGQCDSACPMDIPISRLYHMLHQDLCALFGHESGMDMNPPPLAFITPQERTDMATVMERR